MKKFYSISLLIVIGLLSMSSCGGKGKTESDDEKVTIELKPESEEVSGELEDCFTVVDKTYKVKLEDLTGGILTVELARTDSPLPFDTNDRAIYHMGEYSSSPYVQVGFGIELYDAEGNVVDKTSASGSGLSGSYSPDEAVELVKLSEGKTGTIRFSISDEAKDAVSFKITSAYQYGGSDKEVEVIDYEVPSSDDYNSTSSSDVVETINGSSGNSENWDSILDSYERFAEKYVSLCKKIKNGSVSITSPEYTEYMQEAYEFTEKFSNANSEMTTAQIARMNKIAAKIAAGVNEIR